jgi:hypothetical protein
MTKEEEVVIAIISVVNCHVVPVVNCHVVPENTLNYD